MVYIPVAALVASALIASVSAISVHQHHADLHRRGHFLHPRHAPPVVPDSEAPALSISGGIGDISLDKTITTDKAVLAMAYTPFRPDGKCKTRAELRLDVEKIKNKSIYAVRSYSLECGFLANFASEAVKHGIALFLGIWVTGAGAAEVQAQLADIITWADSGNYWNSVAMLVVGNEAAFNGKLTTDELASLIKTCRQTLRAEGQSVPVVTAETLNVIQGWTGYCKIVDVNAVNLQVYFDAHATAYTAGDVLRAQIEAASKVCPEKQVIVSETGWPAIGEDGFAETNEALQAVAIKSIIDSLGQQATLLGFEDDLWKKSPVDQSFGCLDYIP